MSEVVYFELNNWFCGRDYPVGGNLKTWVENGQFNNDAWCRENKICVQAGVIDMSENWCITASHDWVKENCPELLSGENFEYIICTYSCGGHTEKTYIGNYSQFLCHEDVYGDVWGRFGWPFLEYAEENFGSHYYEEDDE